MVNSVAELDLVLANTIFAGREIAKVRVLDSDEFVFAIKIPVNDLESYWNCAYDLVAATGRWPVVSTFWSGDGVDGTWQEQIENEEYFSRFYYEESLNKECISPQQIIQSANNKSVDDLMGILIESRNSDGLTEDEIEFQLNQPNARFKNVDEIKAHLSTFKDVDELIKNHIFDTKSRYGDAPSSDEIKSKINEINEPTAEYKVEKCLLNWELQQTGNGKPEQAHQDWFTQESSALLLMPTNNSWETLAYINWYGASSGADYYIALLKYWSEKYGAKLVAHYGTMLQLKVTKPPNDIDDAWKLACQHDLASPSTLALPGITVRHHAIGLLGHDRWFFHERP